MYCLPRTATCSFGIDVRHFRIASVRDTKMSAHTANHEHLTEEARTMTAQLFSLRERLQANAELAQLVPFSIQQRGQRDRKRLEILTSYTGPDPQTMRILHDHAQQWYDDPSSFGSRSPIGPVHANDPFVHLACRVLQLGHVDS